MTCGDITDPRIQFAVDVASKLTLVFKSDEQNEFNGVNLSILEYMPPVRTPYMVNQICHNLCIKYIIQTIMCVCAYLKLIVYTKNNNIVHH